MPSDSVSRERWLAAQEQEKSGVASAEDLREWLRVRRQTWVSLVKRLKDDLSIDDTTAILDIGSGPTSVFLGFRVGRKYAVDPIYRYLFELHPFMKKVPEYRDVKFMASSLEEVDLAMQFNVIFMVNVLDHVGDMKPIVQKTGELLADGGTLVVLVDCYADRLVRNLVALFDGDVPHPHHLLAEDVVRLFSEYKLMEHDSRIFELVNEPPFKGQRTDIEIYRLDKLLARMSLHVDGWGKRGDFLFVAKFVLCYSLALLAALIRRREKPLHPLKKLRLFIFRKQLREPPGLK